MKRRLNNWRFMAVGVGVVVASIAVLQVYPDPLFAYSRSYHGFTVSSDRPIAAAIDRVIDDSRRRLSTSSLAQPDDSFRVFICNSPWRLRAFTGNIALGGGTVYATRNIFIRAVDIPSNRLRPPTGSAFLDPNHRSLSYFFAHEATHVLLLRRYGLGTVLRSPPWLVEGYADYVGKAGDFDIDENRRLLRRGDRLLTDETARHGLYRRFQLLFETAIRAQGATIDKLFANPPAEDRLVVEAAGQGRAAPGGIHPPLGTPRPIG